MTNSTLQSVAEAIWTEIKEGATSPADYAQAAISAFKQSNEWKGVVEALKTAHKKLEEERECIGRSATSRGDQAFHILDGALNKLNGGV